MVPGIPGAWEGSLLGGLVLLLAVWQGWWLARQSTGQVERATGLERQYLRWRHRRRLLGTVVMGLVGLGLVVGVRLPHLGNPTRSGIYVAWWTGVVILVLVLVILAMWDMAANMQYGRRSRRALYRQQVEWMRSSKAGLLPGEPGGNGQSRMDDES
jgi:uncharacterized membrane protein (DUF485 family)